MWVRTTLRVREERYLFVNFGELVEVVLQEADLLLLSDATTGVVFLRFGLLLRLEEIIRCERV